MPSKKKIDNISEEKEAVCEEKVADEAIENSASEEENLVKKLEKELQELKDQHLRTLAEYDNYRKRTEKEKLAIYGDAVIATVSDILPIGDNIERAIAQKDYTAEDMKKGVELIYQQYLDTMKKLGVEEMAGEGEEFNPELHNAVAHIEDENLGEGVISAVYQKGYMLKDKVVRHAMVQVAN